MSFVLFQIGHNPTPKRIEYSLPPKKSGSDSESELEQVEYVGKRRQIIQTFTGPFPLEIFEHIVLLGGPQVVVRVARASLACLRLFAPRIYR